MPVRLRWLAVVLVALAATTACEMRTQIGVDVREDGSGTVTVAIGLDDDAMTRLPGIDQQLRTEDLEETGWTVSPLAKEADGLTWFRLSKPFDTPEEATAIFNEVGGQAGPFRDFRLERSRPFARTRFEFEGTVDFSGGLESFGDSELAAALDGEPLGAEVIVIEAQLGQTADRVFSFRVAVRLPGDVSSNAPGRASNGAVWEPTLSEPGPIELAASSQSWRVGTLAWVGVALIAALACLALLAVRLVVAFRRRASPPRSPPRTAGG
ncbi:MAG: hypothetical protein ACRD0U_17075 [Acidimicrobiales bacterium]